LAVEHHLVLFRVQGRLHLKPLLLFGEFHWLQVVEPNQKQHLRLLGHGRHHL